MGVSGGRKRYYQALYDRVRTSVDLVAANSHLWSMPFETVPPKDQPAIVMHAVDQDPVTEDNEAKPPIWYLGAVFEIFVRGGDKRASDQLNDILDQLEKALEKQPGETGGYYTTLGGLVKRCYIADTISFENVQANNQAVVLVPVVMVVAGSRSP